MMGVFAETIELVNRAPVDLMIQFDGQTKILHPGINVVPKVVLSYAKNQNPIMGTQDPYNPHASGAQYLVGVKGTKDNIEPLTKEEWEIHLGKPCREDVDQMFADKYGSDPKARLVLLNKGAKSAARSRMDAGSSPSGNSDFSGKQ